jgi:hypothetical protein
LVVKGETQDQKRIEGGTRRRRRRNLIKKENDGLMNLDLFTAKMKWKRIEQFNASMLYLFEFNVI